MKKTSFLVIMLLAISCTGSNKTSSNTTQNRAGETGQTTNGIEKNQKSGTLRRDCNADQFAAGVCVLYSAPIPIIHRRSIDTRFGSRSVY